MTFTIAPATLPKFSSLAHVLCDDVTTDTEPASTEDVPFVTIVGGGRMGEAVVVRLLASGHSAERIWVATRTQSQADELSNAHGIRTGICNDEAAAAAEVVILAVRPEHAVAVLSESLTRIAAPVAIISFVVGFELDRMLAVPTKVVAAYRVATNEGLVRRAGLLAVSRKGDVPRDPRAEQILRNIGTVVELPEAQQDIAASTLGSGAAFLALAAEAIVQTADRHGISRRESSVFGAESLRCAADLIERAGDNAVRAWGDLATPGGLTEAGIEYLTAHHFVQLLVQAVERSVARANHIATRL